MEIFLRVYKEKILETLQNTWVGLNKVTLITVHNYTKSETLAIIYIVLDSETRYLVRKISYGCLSIYRQQ